jgi:hypothetical protein
MKASLSVNFERFTPEGFSYIPGIVKLWESPGTAGGLLWINYKKAILKISDGTLIRGKINVGELNRLSDLIRMTDEKFIVLVGTLHDESEEKTFIINKNNIIWIETGL